MTKVELPRNVQFVYEHALAQIEFQIGFGCQLTRFDPLRPWTFELETNGSADAIGLRSAYAGCLDGRPTVYAQLIRPSYQGGEYNRTRSPNQFLTHWIYPYKGKFHPQMVRALLNIIHAKPGDLVLDPFIGSGTTALECQLLGIDCKGVDISPLCVTLTKVKTHSYAHVPAIREAIEQIGRKGISHPDELDPTRFAPQQVRDFLQIARMVTYSDMANRKRDPEKYLHKNLERMLASAEAMLAAKREFRLKLGETEAIVGDCRDLSSAGIRDASVDAIVTSPPYSIALDYVKNDAHALNAMGCNLSELREQVIGVRGRGRRERLAKYVEDLRICFGEMARVLKAGRRAVVVIGDATVDGTEVATTEEMVGWAAEHGLVLERQMTKIVWGLYNMMDDEKILFFVRQ
jgi:hypothetical protein